MVTLIGQFCKVSVAQAYLVDLNLSVEMPEFCCCYDKFVWPSTPPEDWEAIWELKL
jgi:hypothetical protein